MAQNVTIPGGTNRKGHETHQGAQKGAAPSDKCSARVQSHTAAVKQTDKRQSGQLT